MKNKLQFPFYFLLSLHFLNKVHAQPFTLDERIKPVELILIDYKKDDTLRSGKINVTTVRQVKDTAYFFVKGLSMYSPVYFGVTTPADSGNIKVWLCKNSWKQAERQGETGAKGHWQEQFKTEGDFGIMVIPERKPAGYTMITWVGKEAKDVGITSAFKNVDEAKPQKSKGHNFLKNNILYIIIGLLALAVVILLYKLKNKKN